ncbi:MAG TPA: DUF2304 domain-containing protein [Patescibacteria group bacterium]
MIFQVLTVVFVLYVFYKIWVRYKDKTINRREFIFWVLVWLIVGVIVLFPELTTYLARLVGIGRGVDLIIYISIAILFYMVFKIFLRIDKIDQEITALTRKTAIDDKLKKSDQSD